MQFKCKGKMWNGMYKSCLIKITQRQFLKNQKTKWFVYKAGIKLKSGTQSHLIEASEAAMAYIDSLEN